MKRSIKYLLGVIFTMMGLNVYSYKSVHSFLELEKIITKVKEGCENPQDILICFDVDLTLTVSSEPAAQWPNILKHKNLFRLIVKPLDSLEVAFLLNLSTKTKPSLLIEKITPEIISKFLNQGIKVLALTNSKTGKLGYIESVEDWRTDQLLKLGISFEKSFPHRKKILLFNRFLDSGQKPIFKNGVLLVDDIQGERFTPNKQQKKVANKGTVLVEFLKLVKYSPKIVIMVDDRVKYLGVVEKALKNFDSNISYLGIEYKGGQKFMTKKVSSKEFQDFWSKLSKVAKVQAKTYRLEKKKL